MTSLLKPYIDSTMMSTFRACPQKFFLEFVEGRRPKGISIDLHAGGCFAGALEETYKQIHINKRPLDEALLFAHARFMSEWGDVEIPPWKRSYKTKDRVWEAVVGDGTPEGLGYFQQYSPLTDHVQPYFDAAGKPTLEYTFAIPLEPAHTVERTIHGDVCFPLHPSGEPFVYVGRFDKLGSLYGRPVVSDDKTASSIGAQWSEHWDLRSQFMGYVWACQQCGIDLDTVVVRGIAIQKTQIVHAEVIKAYSQHLISLWHEQLRRDLWRLRRAYDEHYFDYNLGDSCTSFGNCLFTRVCQSSSPEAWKNEFAIRHWNPLSKNPDPSADEKDVH